MDQLIIDILAIPEESQTLEFKRLAGERVVSKTVETIVAMANAEGGVMVFGIDDPEKTILKGEKRIFGVEEDKDKFDEIGREIQKISPPIGNIWPPKLTKVDNERTIAVLFIPKVSDHFRSFNNDVFIRQQKSNKRLNPAEIVKLSYAKGFEKADRQLVNVDFELLETEYYKIWKEARNLNEIDIKKVLFQTGLARKNEEGVLLPTLAAVILFALHPSDVVETKCTIRVFQFTGNLETIGETPNLIGVPKTIDGPALKLIKDAHEYVLNLLRSGIKIPSGFTTQYIIPERAVKEAITNAVIHRDYHLKRDIEIKIFEDRVEIESPGLLPYNITKNNIGFIRADGYRNDLLVKHLREFPAPPNLDQNEGVRAMRSEMDVNNLYWPIFFTFPLLQDSVRVILFNEKRVDEWEKVKDFLVKNKFIDNKLGRQVTGIIQRDKMSKLLNKWVLKGFIIRIPEDRNIKKGVKYKLANSDYFRENMQADLFANDKSK